MFLICVLPTFFSDRNWFSLALRMPLALMKMFWVEKHLLSCDLLLLFFQTVMIPGPDLKPGEEFDALNYSVAKPEAVQWNK